MVVDVSVRHSGRRVTLHTERSKVLKKNKRLVGAVTSAHLEEWLVSISLFLFLHGAFKEP